ncbi:MAG: hypothetical protein DRO09_03640 [Thermoprotei archaeon]|nr:MAG: hypothetical protein DRO09_03640 [Thermoprotei archaeon]
MVYTVSLVKISGLSGGERTALESVARALARFAKERAYGYVDRLANAYNPSTARQVLTEALRDLKSLRDRGENVWIPKAEEVEVVLELSERDPSILKVVASLALAMGW